MSRVFVTASAANSASRARNTGLPLVAISLMMARSGGGKVAPGGMAPQRRIATARSGRVTASCSASVMSSNAGLAGGCLAGGCGSGVAAGWPGGGSGSGGEGAAVQMAGAQQGGGVHRVLGLLPLGLHALQRALAAVHCARIMRAC